MTDQRWPDAEEINELPKTTGPASAGRKENINDRHLATPRT